MSLEGVRARVTIEAVQGYPSDRFYRLVASSSGGCTLDAEAPDFHLAQAGGLIAFETHENFGGMTAALDFTMGPVAVALQDLVKPNDLVMVELAGVEDDIWSLAFIGLAGSIRETAQGSPSSYRASVRIQAEGLQKLFNQSIFNWQGVMALGEDRVLGKDTFEAYQELVARDGMTLAPHEVIKAMVKIGVSNSIKAMVHKRRIAPGDLFDFGPGWGGLYKGANFPLTAGVLMQEWSGSLWNLLQSLAEPDIHELFWSIRTVGNEDKPVLMHRPRPFPDGGGQGDKDWMALGADLHVFGKDGAATSLGYMRQISDSGRVNAFHWGQEGFQNLDAGTQAGKLALGWWCDQRGIAKYGFAPRQVSIGILPQAGQSWLDMVSGILERVAYQEAPLYLMSSESRGFGCFLPGVHVGQAMEDWSSGKVTTGYISSITQSYRSTPQGVQISSTVGLSRCIRGVTFSEYPKAAKGLVDMVKVDYQVKAHPSRTAVDGSKKINAGACHTVSEASGIRNADLIKAGSARWGVPSWFMAKLYQNESTFGMDPRMNTEKGGDAALGPMQITRAAHADAVSLGYTTPSGRTPTLEDRRDTAISLDMAAFLVAKRYKASIESAGCPTDSPNLWRYTADAYNKGGAAAAQNGQAADWADAGLVGYGKDLDLDRTKAAFGGIG